MQNYMYMTSISLSTCIYLSIYGLALYIVLGLFLNWSRRIMKFRGNDIVFDKYNFPSCPEKGNVL